MDGTPLSFHVNSRNQSESLSFLPIEEMIEIANLSLSSQALSNAYVKNVMKTSKKQLKNFRIVLHFLHIEKVEKNSINTGVFLLFFFLNCKRREYY